MDNYYRELCFYAYSLTKDYVISEDIVQNVMIKIWNQRSSIMLNSHIKKYLYRSVYYEFIDQYRKTKNNFFLTENDLITWSHNMNEDNDKIIDSLLSVLNLEIEKLPTKCKEVFTLCKLEGLTHSEVSSYLGISTKTVEGHLTKAYNLLKEKLRKENFFID